jgi:hypothetical protein
MNYEWLHQVVIPILLIFPELKRNKTAIEHSSQWQLAYSIWGSQILSAPDINLVIQLKYNRHDKHNPYRFTTLFSRCP